MNYEELEGKEVVFKELSKKGIVVGCDRDIGITIVNTEDKDDYIVCLIGPSSPLWKRVLHKEDSDEVFDLLVHQIKSGYVDLTAVCSLIISQTGQQPGSHPSAEDCAFAQ